MTTDAFDVIKGKLTATLTTSCNKFRLQMREFEDKRSNPSRQSKRTEEQIVSSFASLQSQLKDIKPKTSFTSDQHAFFNTSK